MIKVALIPEFFGWAGGLEFLRNLIVGFHAVQQQHKIEVIVAVSRGLRDSTLFAVLQDYFRKFYTEDDFLYYDTVANDFAEKLLAAKVNIVFAVNGDLGAHFPVPWTAYIADFQHKYMYHLFTEHECFYRETAFAARLRDCKAMIVNANAVKRDIETFYPWVNANRIFPLPFSPILLESWIDIESETTMIQYQISAPYFMICNQFWVHKDHSTAFRAFASIADKQVQLVCSGTLEDYRSPEYIQHLKALLKSLGIADRVKFLGHIPKAEQISLLKNASALVQPTLFEGGPGGGASYDAISLGVPVLLSDIAVNTEIDGELAHFFAAGNHLQLAALMEEILNKPKARFSKKLLIEKMHENQQKLGQRLYEVIDATLLSYRQV